MNNVPDEYIENYANEMLKKRETVDNLVERAIDRKLTLALKNVVKLTKKSISLDDFNKKMSE
jgi:trigger factor